MRTWIGAAIDLLSGLLAELHILRYRLLAKAGVATFQQAAESVGQVSMFWGYRVRQRFYASLLTTCGSDLEMNLGATIAERGTRIGSQVWVGPGTYLDLVDIGDYVLIGPGAKVLAGGGHHRSGRIDVPIRLQGNNPLQATRVGTGAWIGAGAVVLADVGEGAIVGAGAVVTKPVEPRTIVVGNPATVLRIREAAE